MFVTGQLNPATYYGLAAAAVICVAVAGTEVIAAVSVGKQEKDYYPYPVIVGAAVSTVVT